MRAAPRLFLGFLFLLLPLVARADPGGGARHRRRGTLVQFGTLDQLNRAVLDGHTTVGQLERRGDFGLGTFNALDGEMIVLDGWFNTTHMHLRTHVKPESRGQAGRWQSEYHDTMIDHDEAVGELLKLLDDTGAADDTIVLYSTDNGPHANSWPDGATTPLRSEKNTNWEGAFRVPAMVRWPGKIKPGTVCNDIVSHLDWLPTIVAAAGDPHIKEKLMGGHVAGHKTFKVHLDGYNLLPYLTGKEAASPRKEMFYFSDDGDLLAVRYDHWKMVFMEQRCPGTLRVWAEPFTALRMPKMYNLRTDPYEQADITSNTYYDWCMDHAFLAIPTQDIVARFLATFREFPPRQKAASFSIDQVVDKLSAGQGK
jgi:hypothetical protein